MVDHSSADIFTNSKATEKRFDVSKDMNMKIDENSQGNASSSQFISIALPLQKSWMS